MSYKLVFPFEMVEEVIQLVCETFFISPNF